MKLDLKVSAAGLLLCLLASAAGAQVQGDAAKGKPIVDTVCLACHGADGNSVAPTFPRLAGQTPEYLLKQLQDYKKNKRQHEIMSPNVANLSEADMANLALFFAGQKVAPSPAGNADLAAKGKKLFEEGNSESGIPACTGCHGEAGGGDVLYPRIASQHAEYSLDQMKQFATGKRKNDKRLMQTIATRLTDDEAKAVAHYLAGLP